MKKMEYYLSKVIKIINFNKKNNLIKKLVLN